MKLANEFRIEKIADDKQNYGRSFDHVGQLSKGVLAVTNGSGLAVVPVDSDADDHDGLVSTEAIVASRKAAKAMRCDRGEVRCRAEQLEVPGGPTFRRPDEQTVGRFPPWRVIAEEPRKWEQPVKFGIDVTQLARLAEALGSDKLVIEHDSADPLAPIRVTPIATNGAYGIIMPMPTEPAGKGARS